MSSEISNESMIEEYLDEIQHRGLSANTLRVKKTALALIEREIGLNTTKNKIMEFLDGRDLQATSYLVWLAHLNHFYNWAVGRGYIKRNPAKNIPRPKLRTGLPRPISDSDLVKAVAHADKRMKVWVLLGAYEGLRCQEMAGIKREDVLYDEKLLRIDDGKGGKERLVPLHPEVWRALKAYKMPAQGYIFLNDSGRKISANHISVIMGEYFRYLGITSTPHALRHWFATRLLQSTHDIQVVQKTLGHNDIKTTMIYADWDREIARAGVLSLRVPKGTRDRRPYAVRETAS